MAAAPRAAAGQPHLNVCFARAITIGPGLRLLTAWRLPARALRCGFWGYRRFFLFVRLAGWINGKTALAPLWLEMCVTPGFWGGSICRGRRLVRDQDCLAGINLDQKLAA